MSFHPQCCKCGAAIDTNGNPSVLHNGGNCPFQGTGADGNGGHHYQPAQYSSTEKQPESVLVRCEVTHSGLPKREIWQLMINASVRGEVKKLDATHNRIIMEGSHVCIKSVLTVLNINDAELTEWTGKYQGVSIARTPKELSSENANEADSSGQGGYDQMFYGLSSPSDDREEEKSADKDTTGDARSTTTGRSSTQQRCFSRSLRHRDESCRVHATKEQCKGQLMGAHLFTLKHRDVAPDYLKDFLMTKVNGFCWCSGFEDEWSNLNVIIDPQTGFLVFMPEFDAVHAGIDPKGKYPIINPQNKWDGFPQEPTLQIVRAFHDLVFVKERKKMIAEATEKPIISPKCQRRFKEEADLNRHIKAKSCRHPKRLAQPLSASSVPCLCSLCCPNKDNEEAKSPANDVLDQEIVKESYTKTVRSANTE